MTKEDAYARLNIADDSHSSIIMRKILDEFFDSNVCIPKGANRHTHADIIHAYAEGAEIQYKGINDMWSSQCTDFPKGLTYRIKPSEPVYEWKFIAVDSMYNAISLTTDYFTLEESKELNTKYDWIRIQETKRVRQ